MVEKQTTTLAVQYLRHSGLGVSVEELRTVADNSSVLLVGAGQEAGHIHEGDDGDVKGVQEAHEACRLD